METAPPKVYITYAQLKSMTDIYQMQPKSELDASRYNLKALGNKIVH